MRKKVKSIRESKNSETLKSFIEYCKANPNQKFWQALRNWSGNSYIYRQQEKERLEDTFYFEGRFR